MSRPVARAADQRREPFGGKINPTAQRLVSGAEKVMGLLPANIAADLGENLREPQALVVQVLTEIGKFTTQQGNPVKLLPIGKAWTQAVGAKASTVASTVDAGWSALAVLSFVLELIVGAQGHPVAQHDRRGVPRLPDHRRVAG